MAKERAKWGSKQTKAKRVAYKLQKCYRIFKSELMPDKHFISCNILSMYDDLPDSDHISIACNLDDTGKIILHYLSRYKSASNGSDKVEGDIIPYFMLLHILESQLFALMADMKTGVDMSDKNKNVYPLHQVRKWANFFKHPKSFLYLSHHAVYLFENSQISPSFNPELTIDNDFVFKYYHSRERDKELFSAIKGKFPVLVKMPDIIGLTEGVANSIKYIMDIIENSERSKTHILENWVMSDFYFRVWRNKI